MGCSQSRKSATEELDDQLISPFEKSLKLCKNSSKDLDNLFHRYSTHSLMSFPQFKKAFIELDINYVPHFEFYAKFQDLEQKNSVYPLFQTKMMTCLGIVLGCGKIEEKIWLLFRNYDLEIKKMLEFKDLEEMLDHVLAIQLEILPQFAIKRNSPIHTEFLDKIKSSKKSIKKAYVKKIIKDRESISFDEFCDGSNKITIQELLDGPKLRQIAYKTRNPTVESDSLEKSSYKKNIDQSIVDLEAHTSSSEKYFKSKTEVQKTSKKRRKTKNHK